MGVTCTEVHDVVYLDGKLAEDTLDWYAQDRQGNVWYFGENTAEFEDGRPVTLAGTFTAGVNDDKPGIIMEANSVVGDFYRQEFALGNAEDNALVVSLNATVTVPARRVPRMPQDRRDDAAGTGCAREQILRVRGWQRSDGRLAGRGKDQTGEDSPKQRVARAAERFRSAAKIKNQRLTANEH